MLKWCVGKHVVASTIDDRKLIDTVEDQAEVKPEKISDGLLDENVNIHLVRKL